MYSDLKVLFLSFLLFLFFLTTVNAQEMKWGKIPKADLEMKVYEAHPDAEAVVLGDDGLVELEFSENSSFTVLRTHRRIKILKKSAFDRADISIRYSTRGSNKLYGLSAQIISPSGKITKIKKKQIFKEEITKDIFEKKIAFPNVEEGSIIEYKYVIRDQGINELPNWYFQEDIPVRWSRYRVNMPEWFEYVALLQGRRLDVNDTKVVENSGFYYNGRKVPTKVVKKEFILKNAPPLKEEAFITTMLDYTTRVRFQLKAVNYPNSPYRPILTSWEQVHQDLKEGDFMKTYQKTSKFKDILKTAGNAITAESTERATVDKIYSYVQKSMKWNERYWYYPRNIEEAFEKREGNSANINTILLALLRNAGIKAYPALMSTRRHGKHITAYPIIDQFNHLIVYAEVDGKPMFLDAIYDSYAAGFLPINSLNKEAWVLKDDAQQWVDIIANKAAKSTQAIFTLSSEGDLEGMIRCRRTNYQAFGLRYKYLDKGEDTFLEEGIQKALPDCDISAYETKDPLKNKTTYQDKIELSIPEYAESNGDMMYISPMLHEAYDENPFKLEEREYPVEMPYPFSENFIIEIKIPEGYTVESLPEPASIIMENKDAAFTYNISQKEDKIQLVMRMSIARTYFTPEQYLPLKQFYDLIVEKQGEQIVLRKS